MRCFQDPRPFIPLNHKALTAATNSSSKSSCMRQARKVMCYMAHDHSLSCLLSISSILAKRLILDRRGHVCIEV